MITQTSKLQHGEYFVKVTQLYKNITTSVVMKPLNQEELADGWIQVKTRNNKNIHHFSIYLSQLPMNLLGKVKRTYTSDKNKDYYKKIKYGNYHYTITNSVNDDKIFELYRNILLKPHNININIINELYKELNENRVKGCLMICTNKIIKSYQL